MSKNMKISKATDGSKSKQISAKKNLSRGFKNKNRKFNIKKRNFKKKVKHHKETNDNKQCQENKSNVEEDTTVVKTVKVAFHEMGVDDRILEGIALLGWQMPTLVQEQAIPFMLAGKTVVAQARTGSGKTGAFLVPCLHRVLMAKAVAKEQCVRVLVLAPSKELCRQISEMARALVKGCSREIRVMDLSPQVPLEHQRPLLAELPDVVVGSPSRVLSHVLAGYLSLDNIQNVMVDEADLMMAVQHSASLEQIFSKLPSFHQSFITSATLGRSMKSISKLLLSQDNEQQLRNTVILRLRDPPLPEQNQLQQFVIKIEQFDKAVLLYALFRLKKVNGKTIIFVNSVNTGYKLRMFLGQFGIATCILNCELPGASRCDIIEQFNSGRYDTIIATDETSLDTSDNTKFKGVEMDQESGTSRGLDFQFVSNIINFDFPKSVTSYIHRVGRTARGNNQGSALSMVSLAENETFECVSSALNKVMNRGQTGITASADGISSDGGVFRNFLFDIDQLDGFRYRATDVWHMCTRQAITAVRKREISQQLLNSKKLAAFFHDNPSDRALLKHDKSEHGIKTMGHLKHVPDYLLPETFTLGSAVPNQKNSTSSEQKPVKRLQSSSNTAVSDAKKTVKGKRPTWKKGGRPDKKKKTLTATQKRHAMKKSNPLKGMAFSGFSDAT